MYLDTANKFQASSIWYHILQHIFSLNDNDIKVNNCILLHTCMIWKISFNMFYFPSPFNMPFAHGGGVDGGPPWARRWHPSSVSWWQPRIWRWWPIRLWQWPCWEYPTNIWPMRGCCQVLLLVMLKQMATNAHIIAVFNPIDDTFSWKHIWSNNRRSTKKWKEQASDS
jgi:hypothetical protein